MLHKETVAPGTLELIKTLQSDPMLEEFVLVGGTALSLHIGHRTSVDIDLFTMQDFDSTIMLEHLEKNYRFELQFMHRNTLKGIVNHIFVDLISHPYPMIVEPLIIEGVKLSSKQDIAAMKVNAISGDGTRAKDFVDMYFLLREFSVQQIIDFYSLKYSTRNTLHALKSLTWFGDMDTAAWPVMLTEKTLTPVKLKKALIKASRDFMQIP
jgi:hypothetical protein